MKRRPKQMGDGTFVNAFAAAVRDLRSTSGVELDPVADDLRIDGKTCLVTGANSGLGKAAAVELARRGGQLILACRPGHSNACDDIKQLSGSDKVEYLEVDLADLRSVHRLCDELRDREVYLDIALMNAGLMPGRARKTPQGFEMMFAVHFLSSRVMIDRWLKDGVIRPGGESGNIPRIVFISSESHRSSNTIDFDNFGAFTDYGIKTSLKFYGISKLVLCTYATELSRRLNPDIRLNPDKNIAVAVHAICPGGVATNIARDAPAWLRPIVNPVLRRMFQAPEDAINPVIYLCCAEESGSATGLYLHMMRLKSVSAAAADPDNGSRLWEASEPLVASSKE